MRRKSDLPRITLVTPSYNQAIFLEQTIRSVLAQRYQNLEYIIMDGGSTDGSVGIIKKYSTHLTRWVSEKDSGQASAIADGFRNSSGDIMGWINSDDLLAGGALYHVAEVFRKMPSADFLSGGGRYIDSESRICANGKMSISSPRRVSWRSLLLYEQDGLFQPSCFWKRSLYRKTGGVDPKWRFIMDREFFVRALRAGGCMARTERTLSYFRLHESSKSANIQSTRKEEVARMANGFMKSMDRTDAQTVYFLYRSMAILDKFLPFISQYMHWDGAAVRAHQKYIDKTIAPQ